MGNELVNRQTGEVVQNQVLSPVNLDLVVESFQAYQAACEKLLTPADYQTIQGKQFKKKSAWRKLGTAYCISTEIREERREDLITGGFVYHFKVRAIANNGRYAEGVGSCSSDEKGLAKTEHNTRSIAETRATNRAISNLIGAGEVSAEEIEPEEEEEKAPKATGKPSEGQLKRLHAIKKSLELSDDEVKAELKKRFEIDSTKDLTLAQYNSFCDTYMPQLKDLKQSIIAQGNKAAQEL